MQRGNEIDIAIRVQGAPPGIVHWQHFHGFANGRSATCPGAGADANGDGIIDLIETEPSSGTTMVPFISKPQSMDIPGGSYPSADAAGAYAYRATVPLDALVAARTLGEHPAPGAQYLRRHRSHGKLLALKT